jgi:predicted PurR-regulated permease PerM
MTNQETQSPTMFKWLVFVLLLMFIYHIREVFPPFIVGGIIAYLLFPLVTTVNKLNRFGVFRWMNPKFAILFIYLTTAGMLGFLGYKFGPTLAEQVSNLIDQRHVIVTNLVTQIANGFNMELNVEETSRQILKTVESSIGKPEELVHLGGLLSHGLLSLLVCIVSSIYFIVDSRRVGKFFLRFVPDKSRVTAVNMIAQMNLMLSKYVVGQLVLIVLMSGVAGLFLSLLKMKYALVIAILSGIFEIIPVLGPFIAISIAVIVGVSQFGVSIAPWIILFYFVARQLEDYYVIPLIIGRAVELHALAVIFAVLVGETMAGALGMLIAIPVAASIKVILDTFYPPEEHSPPAHEEPNLVARILQFVFSARILQLVFSPMRKRHPEEAKETNAAAGCEPTSQPNASQHGANGEDDQKQKVIEWTQNKGHNNEDNLIKTMAREEALKTEQAELVEQAQIAKNAQEKKSQINEAPSVAAAPENKTKPVATTPETKATPVAASPETKTKPVAAAPENKTKPVAAAPENKANPASLPASENQTTSNSEQPAPNSGPVHTDKKLDEPKPN